MSPGHAASPGPDDLARARTLLGPTLHDPVPRARRVAGLYAALYLEDPLLHQWGGLAAFVARHVHLAMEAAGGLYEGFAAHGNLLIYEATMPAFLRLRDRLPAQGPLAEGFHALWRADRVVASELAAGEALAADALRTLARIEQVEIVQPAYAALGAVEARALAPLMRFRLGWDTAAPVLDFDGRDGRDPAQRLRWALTEVLPAWTRLHRGAPALLRADLDRVRRWAEVRDDDLPARRGVAPV